MAKGMYIGIGGTAKKIKKAYVGIDGVARKIKKAYIGIGGVARPFFSSEEIVRYGATTNLLASRSMIAAASNESLAIFAGGMRYKKTSEAYKDTLFSEVDAYNSSLSKVSVAALPNKTTYVSAHGELNRVLLFGGNIDHYEDLSTVLAYNKSGTQTTPVNMSTTRQCVGVAKAGTNIIVAGGIHCDNTANTRSALSTVDVFNASLTKSTGQNLHTARVSMLCGAAGNKALFYGGETDTTYTGGSFRVDTIDYYDAALTHGYIAGNQVARSAAKCVIDNSCISNGACLIVDNTGSVGSYNESLTYSTIASHQSRLGRALGMLGSYMLVAGGRNGSTSYNTVYAYNSSFTSAVCEALEVARNSAAATTIGNFLLFAGGVGDNVASTLYGNVDAYTITE